MNDAEEKCREAFRHVFTKSRELFEKGSYEEALEILNDMQPQEVPEEYRWLYFKARGLCFLGTGRVRESCENLRRGLFSPKGMTLPEQRQMASNYFMYSHYLDGVSDEHMKEIHMLYRQLFPGTIPFSHAPRERKKLRMGYLSPNLMTHIVLNFVIQLFSEYDRERFEVHLYQTTETKDEVSEWVRGMADGWRNLSGLDAYEAARRIHDDGMDILFDLAGHSEGGATLPICAYKPAPVQICGIGWFDTTGLGAMDYFLSDPYCDPPENDALFSEKLLRLPHSHFCYTPPETVLACRAVYHVHEPVVFGSFNNFDKITDEMLRVWKRLLQRVPGARLLLKDVSNRQPRRARMRERLAFLGFREEQVEVRAGSVPYLDEYMDMDIALDTFPYTGGGTTCEALYMGVPVVTRYGRRHGSRFGYSLLMNLGVGELAAATEEQYIEIAASLAEDRELLYALHSSLRGIMQRSPLMDARGYVRDMESAYEKIWKEQLKK